MKYLHSIYIEPGTVILELFRVGYSEHEIDSIIGSFDDPNMPEYAKQAFLKTLGII